MELAIRNQPQWPNMMIFPKELRDAIPEYGGRALAFDSISGVVNGYPLPNQGPRAQAKLLLHETGELNGHFEVWIDLDSATMRALGQFLTDLAVQAETEGN